MADLWSGKGYIWDDDEEKPYGTLNPEQGALVKSLGPQLQKSASELSMYPGQLSAPISQGEMDVVGNSARLSAMANNTFNNLQYDPTRFNQEFESEIAAPTYSSYARNVLPLLQEAVPGFSTARGNITRRALLDVNDQLLTARNTARTSAQKLALDAATQGGAYNTSALKIAAAPREITQAGLDRSYNDYLQANKTKQTSIDQALNFLGISTVTREPGRDPLEVAIALAKAGAQIGAAAG